MNNEIKNQKIIVFIVIILLILLIGLYFMSRIKPDKIQLSGTIESTQIDINSEVAGRILKLLKDEGDRLNKDDVIAVIDSSSQELVVKQQEANYENAKINYDYWVDMFNRIKPIYNSGNVSEQNYLNTKLSLNTAKQQLDQIQASLDIQRLNLSKYSIKCPIDGVYLSRNVEVGDLVNIGSNIATVSDLDNLWVKFYIPQKYISFISLKQKVAMETPAYKGRKIYGEIIYIADQAEFTPKNTETEEAKENTVFKLKVKILTDVQKLKPGMTLTAFIPIK
jgi:HlyD family secretion protein